MTLSPSLDHNFPEGRDWSSFIHLCNTKSSSPYCVQNTELSARGMSSASALGGRQSLPVRSSQFRGNRQPNKWLQCGEWESVTEMWEGTARHLRKATWLSGESQGGFPGGGSIGAGPPKDECNALTREIGQGEEIPKKRNSLFITTEAYVQNDEYTNCYPNLIYNRKILQTT